MNSPDRVKVRTVFGKEVDVTNYLGIAAHELLGIYQNQLYVEGGDPAYVYAWLVANDPTTQAKVRSGEYTIVDPQTDPVKCNGIVMDGAYRLNELVLVKTPKDRYEARKAAAVARQLRREATQAEAYRDTVERLASQITPGATGDPMYEKTEQVRRSRR